MKISRRKLLGGLGACGTGLWLPLFSGTSRGASCAAPPFVITVHAGGGWDPTFFCDPIVDDPRYSVFTSEDVRTAGPIRYLPFARASENGGVTTLYEYGGSDFFQKHAARMVVINGVDTETVSHDVGSRFSRTGSSREGYPSLSALVAGLAGPSLPLAFVVTGAVETGGLVVPTGASGRLSSVWDPTDNGKYIDSGNNAVLQNARWQRDLDRQMLNFAPLRQSNIDALTVARNANVDEQFVAFAGVIANFAPPTSNEFSQAASIALAAMAEGLCAAAHLSANGAAFDTHSEHNDLRSYGGGHRIALNKTLEGLDYIIDMALATPAIAERGLVVHVASEFGRTAYNDQKGKDHWPITSNLVFAVGAAEAKIRTERVFGGTSLPPSGDAEGVVANHYLMDGDELVAADPEDPDAFTITPGHVHLALRSALGLCDDGRAEPLLARLALPDVGHVPLPIL
jgi:hypothetical protein